MRALWLEDNQLTCRDDIPPPAPDQHMLKVKVTYAGICGTDMELIRGYYNFRGIPGHEFTGLVVQGPEQWLNKRIVASINIGCGDCGFCNAGIPNHCANRRVVGIKDHPGAFAEFVSVPIDNAFELPDDIDEQSAVLVEPLAAALEILEQVSVNSGTRVLVAGAGRLAQLVMQVLANSSDHVDVLVRTPSRYASIEPLQVTPVEEPVGDYDLVVDCTGNPSMLDQVLKAVRPRGTVVMKSTYTGRLSLDASYIVVNELNLIGSRCGPFDKAITWLREGRIKLSHITFKQFALEDYEPALDAARDPSVYKVLFRP
ncbi:MAG: alcohol dehydrogenase catalytic domain-containing protein [Pseudomonadales bacterium]